MAIVLFIVILAFIIGLVMGVKISAKYTYNDIKRLDRSNMSDAQFRDIVVNTYVTEKDRL